MYWAERAPWFESVKQIWNVLSLAITSSADADGVSWNAVSEASGYKVEYSQNNFKNILYTEEFLITFGLFAKLLKVTHLFAVILPLFAVIRFATKKKPPSQSLRKWVNR